MNFIKVLVCVFLFPMCLNAQTITFTKYYDFGIDGCFNVLELNDGYLTATMAAHPFYPQNIYIVKTDFYGDTLWTKEYGSNNDYFIIYMLIKTSDSNFLLGCFRHDINLINTRLYLMKINSLGDTLWTREYVASSPYHYNGCYGIETSDKGFLITGQKSDSLLTDGDLLICKTDSAGNFQWLKTYGGSQFDAGYSSIELADKGFLTVGWTRSFGLGNRDLYLIKTDSLGNFKWQKTYGTTFADGATGITKTADGNYLIGGYKGIPSVSSIRPWLIKVDTAGIILWEKTYANTKGEIQWARELPDGSIAGVGSLENASGNPDSAWIVKTDAQGIMLWDRGFVSYNDESYFRDFQPTSDGGFICAGFVFEGPTGTQDSWLIKLDSLGCDSFGCANYTNVGINDINYEDEFSVYPNPANDFLTIRFSYSLFSVCDIKVYNMLGEEVYNSRTFIQKQTAIPVSHLTPGIYFLSLRYEGQMVTRKFVKK